MDLVVSRRTILSLLFLFAYGFASEATPEKSSRSIFTNGPCVYDEFRCSNDKCVPKFQFCNGRNDCGDNSDEQYCAVRSCPASPPRHLCSSSYYDRCIPISWKCDGYRDCRRTDDEYICETGEHSINLLRLVKIKRKALKWILTGRNNESLSNKWGAQVAKKAVAWFLSDQDNFLRNNTFLGEMAYEVSLNLLSKVAWNTLKGVSSSELASHVNAFLVTCVDPRNFYGMDLVDELRNRVDASNETHPFVLLALCNAGDDMSDVDVSKMVRAFWTAQQNQRTDVEALSVLALSCAAAQDQWLLENVDISDLTAELKKKQYRNGTVESLKTTALVMQALYASQRESDEDNFDEEKALTQIIKSQETDGSFGNMLNTYYVLPVLSYRSLINISSSHCEKRIKDGGDSVQDLLRLVGRKSTVRFSVWIGNNRTLERTIALKVPSNISFYGVMEWAARIDPQYRFKYSMLERKPYIYSISNIQDDPEANQFWSLHSIGSTGNEKPILITKSPADVYPTNGQHLVFWYKND